LKKWFMPPVCVKTDGLFIKIKMQIR
jgi:hypothetical protein